MKRKLRMRNGLRYCRDASSLMVSRREKSLESHFRVSEIARSSDKALLSEARNFSITYKKNESFNLENIIKIKVESRVLDQSNIQMVKILDWILNGWHILCASYPACTKYGAHSLDSVQDLYPIIIIIKQSWHQPDQLSYKSSHLFT